MANAHGACHPRRVTAPVPWLAGYEGPRLCALATPLLINCSWMSTARCWTRFIRHAGCGFPRVMLPGTLSGHWSSILRLWGISRRGIWEVRGDPRHFTHSKVMAWVAFDRAIRTVEEFGLDGPADHWRDLREQLHHQVCREAFDPELEYAFRPSLNAGTEATVLGVLSLVFWAASWSSRSNTSCSSCGPIIIARVGLWRCSPSPCLLQTGDLKFSCYCAPLAGCPIISLLSPCRPGRGHLPACGDR